MKVQRRIAVLAGIVGALACAAPASAGIWTPYTSGTTQDITAVDQRPNGDLFYVTSGGLIFKNGAQVGTTPGIALSDIAMSPDGTKGIAVGDAGKIVRSTDGGATWGAAVGARNTSNKDCGTSGGTLTPLTDPVVAVSWRDNVTAYAVAQTSDSGFTGSPIQRTNDSGATWSEINRNAAGTCKISDRLTDVQAVQNTDSVYFIAKSFGDVYFSADALAGTASHRSEMVNCFDKHPRLAVDQANPNFLASSDQCTGTLSFQSSTDSGTTASRFHFAPDDNTTAGFFDVSTAGGTTMVVGTGGAIYNALDSHTAYSRPADGTLATKEWRAVDVSDATHAAVGGVGGAIATTTQANSIPDLIAPAGTITGPVTAVAGTPTAYTANLSDNAGGSGIDAASILWSTPGLPNATGNPVNLTFPSAGFYTITVNFKDLAGNAATATLGVTVNAAPVQQPTNAQKNKTSTVPGATITFGVPAGCVQPGTTFVVTLTWKKQKRKGNRFVKVRRADFYIGSKRVKIDRKAPFRQTLKVTAGATPGSTITLRARAYIKVKHGKSPTKSIKSSIKVCG